MDNNKIQLIGAPCGHHGQYTFYKAFKYNKNGKHKILALSDFFFVKLWTDSDLMSIGELQLLWMDKNSEQVLASLRLYFLPENTPEGRNDEHGEDEVLAISEKVVLRVEDLLDRISEDAEWCRGLTAVWEKECRPPEPEGTPDDDTAQQLSSAGHHSNMILSSALDFQDILTEKAQIVTDEEREQTSAVVVLSFPRYCRYRGIVKRLEGVTNKWLRNALVVALGGFAVPCRNTRILFCKDTFDYPDLEGHELLCNHLAPNLKARPRRKRKKRSVSPGGSESNESEESSSVSTASTITKSKPVTAGNGKNGLRCNSLVQPRRSVRSNLPSPEEKEFLIKLHRFMKLRQTPIGRVPHLGFKEIDLFAFFTKVQKLGGYNAVTANRMWKPIYDDLGGHQGSTSAATCTRRHYERLLLPYEKSVKSDDAKERRRSKSQEDSPTKLEDVDVKPSVTSCKIPEGKTSSSLRSVRTKPDKSQQDGNVTQQPKDKENIPLLNRSELEIKQEPGSSESSGSERPTPELIDLVSEQDTSPTKAPLPALKKRKLDILKEGGLEVTAITPPSTSIGSVTITPDRRPSVIQHAAPAMGQVSITVTPDLSHMLGSPPADLTSSSSTPSPTAGCESSRQVQQNPYVRSQTPSSNSSSDGWAPPRVMQSRSIYAHSEKTVYGNPKDTIEPPSSLLYRRKTCMKPAAVATATAAPPGGEVLDLRVSNTRKPAISISRVSVAPSPQNNVRNTVRLPQSKTNGVSPFPLIDGRAMVGSNLEITVVDVSKPVSALPQRQPHQQRAMSQQSHHQSHQSHQPQRRPVNAKLSARQMPNNKHSSVSISHMPPHRNNNAQLVIPNPYGSTTSSSNSRSRQQTQSAAPSSTQPAAPTSSSMPYLPTNSSLFPNFLSQLTSASGGGSASKSASQYHLPLIDPVYYSALYGNPGLYPQSAAAAAAAFLSPPMFAPTAEQLQLYKELMNHHHGSSHFTPPGSSSAIGSILGLPRDGSTSITPIGRSSTPTSK